MARGNTYTCLCCGKTFEFCPKCSFTEPTYEAENFCSEEHNAIFAALSKHGCGLASAEETLEALKAYNTKDLAKEVMAHINSLQPKKAEVEREVVETRKNSFRTQE